MKTMKFIKKHIITSGLFFLSGMILMAQTATEVRTVENFTGIDAGSIFNIEYTQGDSYFLEVESQPENLGKIETGVSNGILSLKYSGSTRNVTINARIISPVIDRIDLSTAASFTGMNPIESEALSINLSGATSASLQVNTTTLETKLSGASSLVISGNADHHNATASGASQLRAQDLTTQTTIAKASGASNLRLNATEYLDANASGTSKISYLKEPASIQIKTSGMASVNGMQAHMVSESVTGDTTRIRLGGRDLIVIDDKGRESIRMERRSGGFRKNWSGFEMGINGYMTPDNSLTLTGDADYIDLRYNKSVVVNLNFWQQSFPIVSNNLGLVTGLGLGFNNYRFDNQTRIVYNREGLDFYTDTINSITKNKLTLTWINLPLLLEFQTHGRGFEKFHIAGGMIVGTRIGTHAKYVIDDAGKKRKEKNYHDFHVPPFRFDLTGRIGWGRINLFATYSLNNLFKDDKGPELVPFSVGIRLVNW
jgi:hypothetical protein